MDTIDFPDEFEEYRARARSGGSLFGLLRRDAGQDELLCPPPQRQRSRSLVPRSAPLETDQDVLRALYESTIEPEPCRRDPLDLCVPSKNKDNNRPSAVETNSRTPSLEDEDDDEGCSMASKCRDRGYSLPVIISSHVERDTLKPPDLASITGSRDGLAYRRRSFSTTPKGIKNDGDLLVSGTLSTASSIGSDIHIDGVNGRSRASSSNSQESCSANVSDKPAFKVLMLGGPGVGKTALTQQFMTSEYVGAQNTSFDTSLETSIPVQLDGEESVLDCIDVPYTGDPDVWAQYDADAFVVVYSITDRRSFQKAADLLEAVGSVSDTRIATILVANKSDLVRSRIVSEKEGKLAALEFDAKYTEVSAVLNHKVDHLLAGVLKQIRLTKGKQKRSAKKCAKDREVAKCLSRARIHLLGSCFNPTRGPSKSCENLLAL